MAGTNQLPSGGSLKPYEKLLSANGDYCAVNQLDFNFCVYKSGGTCTWNSNTWHKGKGDLIMQSDGNLVLYDTKGDRKPKWASNTAGKGTAPWKLIMQDDGNLVIYDANSNATWASNTVTKTNQLPSGGSLKPGEKLVSANGDYSAVNQEDFNFCVYKPGGCTWASQTWHKGKGNLIMQSDGNLVLYDTEGDGKAKWASNTDGKGTPPYTLIMQDDGNLVIYDAQPNAIWATNTMVKTNQLTSGGSLKPGEKLVSANGDYSAVNQEDFNFCVYKPGGCTWASQTWHKGKGDLIMQSDGNLVLYDTQGDGKPKWASNTAGKGKAPYKLTMQNDGNLVIYDAHSNPIWATNTMTPNQIPSGGTLKPTEKLVSKNGDYCAVNQEDFNFCVYKPGGCMWSSQTWHKGKGNLIMQSDGNLVLYDTEGDGKAKWASNTDGKGTPPYKLIMQDDGNLVIYDANSNSTWATNTVVPE